MYLCRILPLRVQAAVITHGGIVQDSQYSLDPGTCDNEYIIDRMFDFDELSISSQDQLFKRFSSNVNHCLHQLLPELRNTCYMLRQRGIVFRCLLYREPCLKRVLLLIIYTRICNVNV